MWMWNTRRQSQGSRVLGSRSSQSSRASHASHTASYLSFGSVGKSSVSSQHKELGFEFFIRQTEALYPPWWTRDGFMEWYRDLPDDTLWNCYICGCVLLGVIWTVAQFEGIYIDIVDVIYNISYAIHVFAIGYKIVTELESTDITFWVILGFLVDLGSFAHYVKESNDAVFKLICYYVRLHRPYKYLWSLTDYNLKGSILGTTLKYCYIFMVLRITWAYIWLYVDTVGNLYPKPSEPDVNPNETEVISPASRFLSAAYLINKMFIPIGPSEHPDTDLERIVCLLIMLSGCLVVTGAAVASLSLVVSLYMRPEEAFRSRYRLIMKEMRDTKVPSCLREKVETFYKMYWHKQRAVSETQLLPTFPPTLPATINIDIYYEATQKARILRELSYQILSELARKMETVHYIPGDAIIKRGSKKCKIIYITYGDVEMLTAEDDTTAILRMTRGTVLTPCGCTAAAAVSLSHLAVRAATFCTAHVLTAASMWRVVTKHSVTQDHAGPILASFTDHIEKVKRHYQMKIPDDAIHKSSILNFNRNLMVLKEMKNKDGKPLIACSDVFLEIAGCYIMRSRPDASLTDQSDEICLRPTFPCILQPSSSLLVAWHGFVAMLILVVSATHPYFLVYKKDVSLLFRFFDYVMTAIFILDHVVHLSTGANVEEGVPITFAQTSSQQMRSHWFVLDVVATLPVFEFVGEGHFAGINKLLRLPKLFRVLKSLEESCVYRSNVLRFLSYTLLLLIACYLIAAMQQAFMCYQSDYCLVTNFTHPPFWSEKPLDDDTVQARLVFGLYWAISMINFSIHRETWGKDNWTNVIYTMVILEICIVLRIFMEAVYSATIMVTTAPREDYGSRIKMVKSFLVRNEVDTLLMKRFITYLQLCWHTDKAYKLTHKKHSNIFYDLPAHVYQDIVGRNRSKYILVIPFMKFLKRDELRQVSSLAKLFYTSPNEILLNTGELSNEIYIIKQGICEILDPVTQKRIGTLTTRNHFAALICLLRIPAYYTVRAITHVQVLCLPRKHLSKAFQNRHIMHALEYIKTRPEYQRAQTKLPSFIKYVPQSPTPNMMHFRLPRKHEPDSEFLHPFTRLGFLSILRYVFPRYTIRPDGKYLQRYEWFRVICALCSAQVFPHYTYLVLQWPFLYYVTFFLDMSAYFDIFQRMLIGYFNSDGILVYHPSSTAAYYIKGAFLVDLFSCLSLENLESTRKDNSEDMLRLTATKQLLMLNRLIQLYRMPSAMMVLKEYVERRDILMVFQAIPLFMAMVNVLTCFVVFYSVNIYYSIEKDGTYNWLIEPFNDNGGSWLYLFKDRFRFNLTATPWNLHLATYFWVVYECTTTGYGIFNPSNHDIMQVLFVGIASSAMIITYYSVRIISIRANVNKSLAGFQQHMKDINVYMVREKLDPELLREIRRYYEYNWEKMGGIDYRGVLKMCDQITLRTDAILHIYGPTFAKCPMLVNADVSLLRIIGRAVRSVYFLRDMKILDHDDMVTGMYFVDYGGVEVRASVGDNIHVIRLPRGSVFGNLEGSISQRSPYQVVATGRLHLLMIKAHVFVNITKDFPAVMELMNKSKTGIGKDNKMYILGGEATVRIRRNIPSGPPPRSKTSILKYIYFQEDYVQMYLIAICLGCIYLDMYNAGYQDNSTWMLSALYSLDFAFFLKIFTQHSLPFLVPNKNIKKMMLPIRKLYFKGEFRYDLISILPFELLSLPAQGELMWLLFAWLRLNRVFRIATVYKCLRRRNERITVNLKVTTIVAVLIWFTLFVHATSCLWYFMGTMEDYRQPNSSWIHLDSGDSHCDNHYICALYFVITTFTQNGVGDIMPKKRSEVLFVAILQVISTMVFMVYVGEFSNIIQYQSYRSFNFYSKYLELQEFMRNNRVSQNLVTIVNKYTLHLWRENRGLQVPHFLAEAPLSLRLRVMSAAYLHHITRHHIFEECEASFLRQLVGRLKLYTYNEGMYVVKESEITDAMYVIHNGKVKETSEEMDISARVYPTGSYFGVLQGLLRNTPYTHSYQTVIKSQVLTLKLDDWEYLLKHFPDSKDAIHKHMRQLGDEDMDKSNWPGGAPVDGTTSQYLLQQMDDVPLDDLFPGTARHFGRDSGEDDTPMPTSALRRPSLFLWPTDRDKDEATEREVHTEEAVEVQPKMGIFQKIVSTAKKIMGRVSDSEILAMSTEGKDELLLEEDTEATEALLAQFESARKMTEKKEPKKFRARSKSVFYPQEDDETTEKQLVTLEMTESMSKLEDETSEPFVMRPLRIRDSESEEPPSKTAIAPEVLNLGRSKSRIQEPSEVQVTIDIAKTESAGTSDTGKETELTQTALQTTDSKSDKKAVTSRSDENALDTKRPKLLLPTTIQKSSEIQATIDMTKSKSSDTTESTEETALTETALGTLDVKPVKETTVKSTTAQESSEIQVVIDMTKTVSGDTAATIEETLETVTSLGTMDSKLGKKTTGIIADEKITETQADEMSEGTTHVKALKGTQDTQETRPDQFTESRSAAEDSQSVQENKITKALNLLYPELPTTEGAEATQANQGTTGTQARQVAQDTRPDLGFSKAPLLFYPGPEAAQGTSGTSTSQTQPPQEPQATTTLKRVTLSDISIPGPKPIQDTQTAKDTQEAQLTQKTTSTQATLDIKDTRPAQESTGVQADQYIKDTQPAQETTSTQVGQEDNRPTQATTSVQAIKDEDTARETKGTQAAQHIEETRPAQDTTGTQAALGNKDAKPAQDTKSTQATEETGTSKSPSTDKFILFMSDTSMREDPDVEPSQVMLPPRPTFAEEAARKRSFSRKPILFDPDHELSDNLIVSPQPSLNPIKLPAASASDIKLIQFMSDTDVTKTDDAVGEVPTTSKATEPPKKEEAKEDKRKESDLPTQVKEEGTHTSASKPNRRFVHVRYEERTPSQTDLLEEEQVEEDPDNPDTHLNIFTLDSDEPQEADKSAGPSNEEEEAAPSTSGSTNEPFINYPYYRKRSD